MERHLDASGFLPHNRLSIGFCRDGDQRARCNWLLDRRGRRPASILPAGDAPTDASFVFALYAAARALPLAGFVLVAIYKRASSSLLVLGGLAGIAQFLDAGIGVIQHDPGKIGGPLVIAVLQMLALWGLSRSIPKQAVPSLGA
jgi:hypothetical protein